jgi:hypothetical protein
MPDCSKEAQKVADLKAQIADLQPSPEPEHGAGPVQHPSPALAGLQRELVTAEAALSACLNQPVVSTLFPRYLVTNILYNPPGISSESTYGAGSTTGVTVEVTNSFKRGLSLSTSGGFLGNGLDASVQYAVGAKDGTSSEIKKERNSTLSITSKADPIDHSRDLFYVWTNIKVDAAQRPDQSISLSVGVQGAGTTMDIVVLTGAELLNPALIPDFKKTHLKLLTPADYATIAALNPLLIPGATEPAPDRYRYLQTFSVNGPDNPGDSIPGLGIELSDEKASGGILGDTKQLNVAVTLDTGFNIGIAKSSLSVGLMFEWDYEMSRNVSAGTKESAAVVLRSETLGYHKTIDVYQDTMFKTLAFFEKPETDGMAMSALTGTVTDAANKPVFNSRVDVVLSSGKRYTTFTNQQGAYRLSAPTQGNAEIHVADMVKTVALTAPAITVSFQPGATPLQPADVLAALQEVGVTFSVPEAKLKDWLSNAEFTPYPAMAQALLALLRSRPLRQPVPIDVIVSNYEQTPSAASPRRVDDVDQNFLKNAILEGYNERYLPPARSFEETLR